MDYSKQPQHIESGTVTRVFKLPNSATTPEAEERRQTLCACAIAEIEDECYPLLVAFSKKLLTLDEAYECLVQAHRESPTWKRGHSGLETPDAEEEDRNG